MTRAELNAAWNAFNRVNFDTDKAIEAHEKARTAYLGGAMSDAEYFARKEVYTAAMARYDAAFAAVQDLPHVASDDAEDDQLTLLYI
jgi:hypothetical protein